MGIKRKLKRQAKRQARVQRRRPAPKAVVRVPAKVAVPAKVTTPAKVVVKQPPVKSEPAQLPPTVSVAGAILAWITALLAAVGVSTVWQ